ncbi:hypothetical protein [Marinobacterium jannaschii]|uniref:hypothetical protein n=1 Tax=Marinobacterium jannaschii TaxID=64970 RepID=UPI000B20B9C9|nr:hypothetical protein [Marinobacterium jannaschii]
MNTHTESQSPTRMILIAATLVMLGVAVWLLPQLLNPAGSGQHVMNVDAGCDLHNSRCEARAEDRRLLLAITPGPIKSMQPLEVSVELKGWSADMIALSLSGKDMYMGLNQIELKPDSDDPNIWRGQTQLAVCVTGEMIWQAKVSALKGQGVHEAVFEFAAQ